MQIFTESDGRTAHLKIRRGDLPPYVLCPGSPERVREIGKMLDGAREVCDNRGLVGVRGSYLGVEMAAVNTGMGPATTSIVVPEIVEGIGDADRMTIIRVGTCGSLQPQVKVGDLVVTTAAIRDEGTTQKWVPPEYPAVASLSTTLALLQAAAERGYAVGRNLWAGVTHVKDELYAVENPQDTPLGPVRRAVLDSYKAMGALATEMEYTVFSLYAGMANRAFARAGTDRRLDTGCILLCLSPCHDTHEGGAVEFHHPPQGDMLAVALTALARKAELDRGAGPLPPLVRGL